MNRTIIICITAVILFTEYLTSEIWKQETVLQSLKLEVLQEVLKHPPNLDTTPPKNETL